MQMETTSKGKSILQNVKGTYMNNKLSNWWTANFKTKTREMRAKT